MNVFEILFKINAIHIEYVYKTVNSCGIQVNEKANKELMIC